MSSGKVKKSKSQAASSLPVIPILVGFLIMSVLMGAAYYVMGQRKTVTGYDSSVTQITNALRTRDPESAQGALKLSEVDALVTGNPVVTRETKDSEEFAVYTWPGGLTPVGFRLKIEKNGTIEEVAELVTLGAK